MRRTSFDKADPVHTSTHEIASGKGSSLNPDVKLLSKKPKIPNSVRPMLRIVQQRKISNDHQEVSPTIYMIASFVDSLA